MAAIGDPITSSLLKPFSPYLFLAYVNTSIRIENIVGNIIGFVPFGLMLPLLSKRFYQFKSILIATFCFSFTYEILKILFELGSFDTDDLILNTLGGIIGYLPIRLFFYTVFKKNGTSQSRRRTVIYCPYFVTRTFFRSGRINRVWVELSCFKSIYPLLLIDEYMHILTLTFNVRWGFNIKENIPNIT
ncbi:VanZ family protein [Peribacillus simplex]|uniref:VanZ family protein n=1 Tax=Peribacillus simplex TaxID=1478 RepID=UPI003D2A92A1